MKNEIEYAGDLKRWDFIRADMVTSPDGVVPALLTQMITGHWVIVQEDEKESDDD